MSSLDKHKEQLLAMHKQLCTAKPEKLETKRYQLLLAQLMCLIGGFWVKDNLPVINTNSKLCLEVIAEDELLRLENEIKKFRSSN